LYLKVDTDGSFHHDSHADAIGTIIRDFKGEFVAASTIFLPHISSPVAAKAMAMREELSLVNRLGCSKVIMESDSLDTFFFEQNRQHCHILFKKEEEN
jgi:hypothetical protein